MYNTGLNTNTISHLLKHATITSISKPKQSPQHWHKLPTHITFITLSQNTRKNAITIQNKKHSGHFFINMNLNTQYTCFAQHLPLNTMAHSQHSNKSMLEYHKVEFCLEQDLTFTPPPSKYLQITTYADDITITASHIKHCNT